MFVEKFEKGLLVVIKFVTTPGRPKEIPKPTVSGEKGK